MLVQWLEYRHLRFLSGFRSPISLVTVVSASALVHPSVWAVVAVQATCSGFGVQTFAAMVFDMVSDGVLVLGPSRSF